MGGRPFQSSATVLEHERDTPIAVISGASRVERPHGRIGHAIDGDVERGRR